MSDDEKPAEYQRTGAPGPGSPEYEAMDKLAKMFERQVDELRGTAKPADESN
jgi:hypothetical protein